MTDEEQKLLKDYFSDPKKAESLRKVWNIIKLFLIFFLAVSFYAIYVNTTEDFKSPKELLFEFFKLIKLIRWRLKEFCPKA